MLPAVAIVLVAAPASDARIVLGESIAGVAIGDTKADVVGRLGPPARRRVRDTRLGKAKTLAFDRVTVTLVRRERDPRATVVAIRTFRVRDRTAGGIGVGDPRRAVVRTVAGVRCAGRRCRVGRKRPGRVITQFTMSGGRVASVLVARVLRAPK